MGNRFSLWTLNIGFMESGGKKTAKEGIARLGNSFHCGLWKREKCP
jgi:hypothetical protein